MKAYEIQQLADFGYSKEDIAKIEAEEDAKRAEAEASVTDWSDLVTEGDDNDD